MGGEEKGEGHKSHLKVNRGHIDVGSRAAACRYIGFCGPGRDSCNWQLQSYFSRPVSPTIDHDFSPALERREFGIPPCKKSQAKQFPAVALEVEPA
jgi:hypothetical protein